MRRAKRKVEPRWSEWQMFAAQLQLAALESLRRQYGPAIAAKCAQGFFTRPRKPSKRQARLFEP